VTRPDLGQVYFGFPDGSNEFVLKNRYLLSVGSFAYLQCVPKLGCGLHALIQAIL
jgi:hypothetical protein